MSKEIRTLEDERWTFWLASGAAFFALHRSDRPGAAFFQKAWGRLIPFTKAVIIVAFRHRDELEREWAQAKSEPGPFGLRFDLEGASDV